MARRGRRGRATARAGGGATWAGDGTTRAGGGATAHTEPRRRRRARRLLGLFFLAAGANHFAMPGAYRRIVPPGMGDPQTLVAVSGVAELVGGAGVLVGRTRRPAGLWLIAVLAAVFPANLHMALHPERFDRIPRWALYARLPLQPLMMWWAWDLSR